MYLSVKFVTLAFLFVATGGAVFTEWGRQHKVLLVLAGAVAVVAATYLFRDVYEDLKREIRDELRGNAAQPAPPANTSSSSVPEAVKKRETTSVTVLPTRLPRDACPQGTYVNVVGTVGQNFDFMGEYKMGIASLQGNCRIELVAGHGPLPSSCVAGRTFRSSGRVEYSGSLPYLQATSMACN